MDHLRQSDLVLPDYQGNTIANIPPTVARLLGTRIPTLPPLREELWRPMLDGREIRRVVLMLVDGMGQNLIDSLGAEGDWLREVATISGTISSIFPSTTVNALSSLWTGAGPGQHGLVGLELFFPQLGVMGQMLSLTPSFAWWPDALMKAGVDPLTFLAVPGIGELLAEAGIETHAVKHYSLVNTTLSKMHSRGIKAGHGIVTAADMMWQIGELLRQGSDQKQFISAYWAAVDTLSHRHGFDHPAVAAELRAFLALLRQGLLEGLASDARRGTVVILTADHGQIKTPAEKRIFIEDHPRLQELLFMRSAGEPHAAYLYVRDGQKQAVLDYVAQALGHTATALDAEEALQAGLFGPAPYAAEMSHRIGNVIVTMREGYSLLSRHSDQFITDFVGRHGGLTPDEMEVPFFAFCLS